MTGNRDGFDLDYIILEQEEVSLISLFNLYNFNLKCKASVHTISEQAGNFYFPQIPANHYLIQTDPAKDSSRRDKADILYL